MEEFNETESQASQEVNEPEPMGHLDKMVGVFSEPGETFNAMSKHDPKTTDWLLPIVLMILMTIISIIVSVSNPEIKNEMIKKQTEQMRKQLDAQVQSGQLSQDEADKRVEMARGFMGNPVMMTIIPSVAVTIFTFIWFFLFALVGWLIAKSAFGDQGSYSQAMTALGLPLYISFLAIIVMLILSLVMDKMVTGVSIATITGADVHTLSGFIQSKFDIFGIWYYTIVGIAFAKIFKSQSTGKYIGTSIGLWLAVNFIIFALASKFSFFEGWIR